MKKLLVVLVVLVIAAGAVGYWRGWFTVETKKEDGKTQVGLTINKDKFKEDRAALKKRVAERSKSIKEKIASLRAGKKDGKEVEDLVKKEKELDAKMKEIEEAADDKIGDLEKGVSKLFEDPKEPGKP